MNAVGQALQISEPRGSWSLHPGPNPSQKMHAMARRIGLRRPRPETIAQLEAEIADCDEARRVELMAELDALKAKFRRIPYIDPIDIRYRRFETMPKPVAQASDGDNSISDGEVAGRLLTEMILPVSQFFAYLEVDETSGSTFDMPDSALWTLYQRLRADGAPLSMRRVSALRDTSLQLWKW